MIPGVPALLDREAGFCRERPRRAAQLAGSPVVA